MTAVVDGKGNSYEAPKDFALVRRMLADYDPSKVDQRISPSESMGGANYMYVGQSAVETIIAAVTASHLTEVRRVLDVPCGHGRVLRHLAKLFPNAIIDACDLDREGVQFCADAFDATPIYSFVDFTKVRFPAPYDLIWVGSLFTHLPLKLTERWLAFLAKQLTRTGIVVATFHGRWAIKMNDIMPYLDAERWAGLMSDVESQGYGFRDYRRGETHGFIEDDYGISVAKPAALVDLVSTIPDTRLYMYQEKGWGHNHDVIAFGRPGWLDHPNVG